MNARPNWLEHSSMEPVTGVFGFHLAYRVMNESNTTFIIGIIFTCTAKVIEGYRWECKIDLLDLVIYITIMFVQ